LLVVNTIFVQLNYSSVLNPLDPLSH
jgi:hypothetical protein